MVGDSPLMISNLIGGSYTVEVTSVDSNNIRVGSDIIVEVVNVSGATTPELTETISAMFTTSVTVLVSAVSMSVSIQSTVCPTFGGFMVKYSILRFLWLGALPLSQKIVNVTVET